MCSVTAGIKLAKHSGAGIRIHRGKIVLIAVLLLFYKHLSYVLVIFTLCSNCSNVFECVF